MGKKRTCDEYLRYTYDSTKFLKAAWIGGLAKTLGNKRSAKVKYESLDRSGIIAVWTYGVIRAVQRVHADVDGYDCHLAHLHLDDLMDYSWSSRPRVCRALAMLKAEGLLTSEPSGREMSYEVTEMGDLSAGEWFWVWPCMLGVDGMTIPDAVVWGYILYAATYGGNGTCCVSRRNMAYDVGLSLPTVKRSLTFLVNSGAVWDDGISRKYQTVRYVPLASLPELALRLDPEDVMRILRILKSYKAVADAEEVARDYVEHLDEITLVK